MQNILRILREYYSTGLFIESPVELSGEVSHEKLNISLELSQEIFDWITIADLWINWDDPGNSPETSKEEIKIFNELGQEICRKVQTELDPKWIVYYNPIT